MKAKELLLKQTQEAFSEDDEMSLKTALRGITEQEAAWRLNDDTKPIQQIVHHVAHWKLEYCRQGFGRWQGEIPKPGDLAAALKLLDQAQEHLVECLQACSQEDLDKPIPTRFHGSSAAHFFWVMIMHDLWHGAQIELIRRAHRLQAGG